MITIFAFLEQEYGEKQKYYKHRNTTTPKHL